MSTLTSRTSAPPMPASRLAELRGGWPIVVTAMLGIVPLMAPVHLSGVYMPIWEKNFGWSRAEMALALSLYIATTSLLAPYVGALVDRLTARSVALVSMALLIPAYACFAFLQSSIWTLYAGFVLLAALGAGTTHVVFCRPIVQSFDSARGTALALAQSGTAVSLLAAPLLAYALLQVFDWRMSWLALAALPLALLFLVYFGLKPVQSRAASAGAAACEATGIEFRDAIRSGRFWLFVTSFSLFYFGTAATVGQLVPILESGGLTAAEAITAQGLMGIAVMVGRLGTGYLLDRMFASHIYFLMGAMAAFGFLILTFGVSGLIWVAIPFIGLAIGAEVDIASYMISRYFGQRHFGKLFGLTFAVFCAGGILAHPFYGFVFDATGNYIAASATSMVAVLVAAALLLRQGSYPKFD